MSSVAAFRQAATPVAITVGAAVASYFLADTFAGGSEPQSHRGNVASSMSGWSAIEYRRMPIAEYLKVRRMPIAGISPSQSIPAAKYEPPDCNLKKWISFLLLRVSLPALVTAAPLQILSGWEEVNGVADDRSQRALLKRLADAPSTTAV
ncbi:unnamed protein product [Closterium sp. Yama58-4]|nr:unnamed protein product [Closterium sp. Yama58-4]